MDNRPSRPNSLWDAILTKVDQFINGRSASVESVNTGTISLGEPEDNNDKFAGAVPYTVGLDKPNAHIVIDGVQVGQPRTMNSQSSGERGQIKFGDEFDVQGVDHEGQREPTISWIDEELSKMVDRSDLLLDEGDKTKTVVLNPKHELAQTWGEQVDNVQTCMLASIQMLMGHSGMIDDWQSSFDFINHKMQILSIAKRIDPSLVDSDLTKSLVLEPGKRNEYLQLFQVLEQITQGIHSKDGVGTMDFVGGSLWGEAEMQKINESMPQEFQEEVKGDAFIGKAAMILRMSDSFLTNKGEVFSMDLHASNEAGGDSGHNVVIGGMRVSKGENSNQVEFWVVDPLDKDRGVGYWAKPDTFLNSSCMFIATSAGQREAWTSEE